MNKRIKNLIKGFTIIESMVAIFILSVAIVGIIGMVSKSYLASIYAKNEITATYLIQEAVDYIRNDRDASVILGGGSWNSFVSKYNFCASDDGCYLDVINDTKTSCSIEPDNSFGEIKCPKFYLNENSIPYYSYDNSGVESNFKRKIFVEQNSANSDQLDIYVSVEWKNGNLVRSRSLEYSLLNW